MAPVSAYVACLSRQNSLSPAIFDISNTIGFSFEKLVWEICSLLSAFSFSSSPLVLLKKFSCLQPVGGIDRPISGYL